jgi:predicted regulator of Ras-like GTPase activity (Roadblock/LC7/MglB family)
MLATANVGSVIKDLKTRVAGIATALVSRDGTVLFADLPSGIYAETFATMCATMFGAAATANAELNLGPAERLITQGGGTLTIIARSGTKALLVAVVSIPADLTAVLEEVHRFAELL